MDIKVIETLDAIEPYLDAHVIEAIEAIDQWESLVDRRSKWTGPLDQAHARDANGKFIDLGKTFAPQPQRHITAVCYSLCGSWLQMHGVDGWADQMKAVPLPQVLSALRCGKIYDFDGKCESHGELMAFFEMLRAATKIARYFYPLPAQ